MERFKYCSIFFYGIITVLKWEKTLIRSFWSLINLLKKLVCSKDSDKMGDGVERREKIFWEIESQEGDSVKVILMGSSDYILLSEGDP